MIKNHLKLCLITNAQFAAFPQYEEFILQAVAGGVTLIQLRDKSKNLAQIRQMALSLKKILKPFNVLLLINDHLEIAKEIDVDGIHLGQSDHSPLEAREILGPDKIIGWSVETLDELAKANQLDCIDYIAASAVFPSKTKADCKTIWGLEGLRRIAQISKHPVVAIGGIEQWNVQGVIDHGACGAAVISAIHDSPDPKRAASELIAEINQALERKYHV